MSVAMRYGTKENVSGVRAGGKRGTAKLWSNASPTSNFAAQSIDVDLTGYSFYGVQLRFSTSYDYATEIKIFPVSDQTNNITIATIAQNRTGGRHCTYNPSTKKLTFDGATYNGSSSNAYAIPLYVWGIKL